MHKTILLANIGNRDIGSNGEPLFGLGQDNQVYEKTKEMWDKRDFGDLDLLLLGPLVEYIQPRYNLNCLYLFGTQQKPPHKQDTIFITKIVKELIIRKYGLNEDMIRVVEISKNPSDIDSMYTFFENYFETIDIDGDANIIFVSITGGTPAQNDALMFNTISKCGIKTQVIYLPKGSKTPALLNIGNKLYKNLLIQRFEVLKNKHLYGLAAELAERYNLTDEKEIKLLKARNYQLLFDFDNASRILNEIENHFYGEERTEIQNQIEHLSKLREGLKDKEELSDEYFLTYMALIEELYLNMKIKWEQGAYVDFLGRLFRFEEAVLKYVFEKEFKVSTDKLDLFNNFLDENPEIKKHLNDKTKSTKPDRSTLFFILKFINEEHPERSDITSICRKFERMEKLSTLRNKTIIAHGFKGVSMEEIEGLYKNDIIEDIGKIMNIIKSK